MIIKKVYQRNAEIIFWGLIIKLQATVKMSFGLDIPFAFKALDLQRFVGVDEFVVLFPELYLRVGQQITISLIMTFN